MSLKGIPTWAKLTGSIGLVVILILAYEWKKAKQGEVLEGDPCDPESPAYDKAVCEREASGAVGNPTPNQLAGTVTTGGGGSYGVTYPFLPGGTTPAPPAADVPDVPAPPEAEAIVPSEPVAPLPDPFVVAPPVPRPPRSGPRPVPGSGPGHGLETALPVRRPPSLGPGVALPPSAPVPVSAPAPGSTPGAGVGGAQPAAAGWCGHPDAVGVGQPCGGKFEKNNNPPSGWHWFCCNGSLGRAPN